MKKYSITITFENADYVQTYFNAENIQEVINHYDGYTMEYFDGTETAAYAVVIVDMETNSRYTHYYDMRERHKHIVECVLERINKITDGEEKPVCLDCENSDSYCVSFTIHFSDGKYLSGDDLYFNNIVDIYSVDKEFIEEILEEYPDAIDVTYGLYCSDCLSCID